MDEPRGNWLNDPPDTPRPRRRWRSTDPPQPDISSLMEHFQALEARTKELEAELRRERTAPTPPTPSTGTPEEPARQSDDMTARFTELAKRAFSVEFDQLRHEAERQAGEILAQARTDADRRAREILGRARDEAERMTSAARSQAEVAKAAKAESASRAKGLPNDLRSPLARIDRTLGDFDEGAENEEETSGRASGLVVIPTTDKDAHASAGTDEEPAG